MPLSYHVFARFTYTLGGVDHSEDAWSFVIPQLSVERRQTESVFGRAVLQVPRKTLCSGGKAPRKLEIHRTEL